MQTGIHCFCHLGREGEHPDVGEQGKWGQLAARYGKLCPWETTLEGIYPGKEEPCAG